MIQNSFEKDLIFNDERVKITPILETSFTKEIRITFKEGQVMKEHKAGYPIIVHLLKGEVEFGVENEIYNLKEGDILALDANVPHDLKAFQESIVRLSLSKLDKVERVEKVSLDSKS